MTDPRKPRRATPRSAHEPGDGWATGRSGNAGPVTADARGWLRATVHTPLRSSPYAPCLQPHGLIPDGTNALERRPLTAVMAGGPKCFAVAASSLSAGLSLATSARCIHDPDALERQALRTYAPGSNLWWLAFRIGVQTGMR